VFYITINQQDAAVHSQFFFFTAGLLYKFRVLSTPIIRSTLNCITASSTGHTVMYKGILTVRMIIKYIALSSYL